MRRSTVLSLPLQLVFRGQGHALQLCLVKNHKMCNISRAPKTREKGSADLESEYFYNFLDVCLTPSKNIQILLFKPSHTFLVKTK
jgi:hypothetical protein